MTSSTEKIDSASPAIKPRPRKSWVANKRRDVNVRLLIVSAVVLLLAVPSSYIWYKYQEKRTSAFLLTRADALNEAGHWNEATTYYQRYLLFQPDDSEGLVGLVEAYSKGEPSRGRSGRLVGLLYRTLGRAPERHDLRLLLSENLLRVGSFLEAEKEASKLIDEDSPYKLNDIDSPLGMSAKKVIALSSYARASIDRSVSRGDALAELLELAENMPADAQLIGTAADALRNSLVDTQMAEADRAALADKLIDRLVTENPMDTKARLTRYRYRKFHKLQIVEEDLKVALEADPNNFEATLLAAIESSAQSGASSTNDSSNIAAEKLFLRAIELDPRDSRPYLALASMQQRARDYDGALRLLKRGQDASGNQQEFGLAIATTYLASGRASRAESTLQQLAKESSTFLASVNSVARAQFENRLRILQAQVDIEQGEIDSAARELAPVLLNTAGALSDSSREWLQATSLMAQIQSQANRWDEASRYFSDLIKRVPKTNTLTLAASQAFIKAGTPERAVNAIEAHAGNEPLSHELLVTLVQAHFAVQLSRDSNSRNWTEFDDALSKAQSEAPNRWELTVYDVNRSLIIGNRRRAASLLRAAEDRYSGEVEFWRGAALVYQQLDEEEGLRRAIKNYSDLASSPVASSLLRATILSHEGKYEEANNLLEELESRVEPGQRRQLEKRRIDLLTAAGKFQAAWTLAKQLIDAETSDIEMLKAGIDISLTIEAYDTARQWEQRLADETNSGTDARYFRVRRQLQEFDKLTAPERQRLDQEILSIRSERPEWRPVIVLSAHYAELQGDKRRALAGYKLAVNSGDRKPPTLKKLVSLLYEFGRFSEAEKYLDIIASDQIGGFFFDAMAVELAVSQNREDEAIQIARANVEKHPQDVSRRLYLAGLLNRVSRHKAALKVLQEVGAKLDTDDRIWAAVFSTLMQMGDTKNARKTLRHIATSSIVQKDRRHFIAAQGYEQLGDRQRAEEQYRLAIGEQPANVDIRLLFAQFLSQRNPQSASAQYEEVLQRDPANAQAHRELILLLAGTGSGLDWERANQLLDSAKTIVDDVATFDRLRALLLSKNGRTREKRIANCKRARDILEGLIESDNSRNDIINHLLLAQILEEQYQLSGDRSQLLAARDQLRILVSGDTPSVENLKIYIEFLIRNAGTSTQENSGENSQLATTAIDQSATEMAEDFLADAEDRLADLSRQRTSEDTSLETLQITLQARLLQARGHGKDAKQALASFAKRQMGKALNPREEQQLALAVGRIYTSLGDHNEAEKWYRRLMAKNDRAYVLVVQSLLEQGKRDASIDLILTQSKGQPTPETAIVLANALIVTEDTAVIETAPKIAAEVESTLTAFDNDINVLQAIAVMRASRGEYDKAAAAFRRIIQIDPENALALNNLATLLAERPNQQSEALKIIKRAIDIAGRKPALLDTQGTIQLRLGENESAIASLEEATAGGATDARYYLHLAAAYDLANRDLDALTTLEEARAFGLDNFVLTTGDREFLASLKAKPFPKKN